MNNGIGLILLSHGSLLCGASEILSQHAARLRQRNNYLCVEIGYLNYSEPRFSEAVKSCLRKGARTIVVAPYFLVPGKFVKLDVARAIEMVRKQYPGLEMDVAEPIGYDPSIAEAILSLAEA